MRALEFIGWTLVSAAVATVLQLAITPAQAQMTNPACTIMRICPHEDKHLRHVTAAARAETWRRSGLRQHVGLCAGGCIVDHIVPLEVCGNNTVDNLQIQTKAEAKAKDQLENATHAAVCSGELDLHSAQRRFIRMR